MFSIRKLDLRDAVGGGVFVLVVLITCIVWWHVQDVIAESDRKRFDEISVTQRDILIDRMRDYEQVLLGAAGLFASSVDVDRQEWRTYVDSLRLDETLPGIQGVGYTVMVPATEKTAHEQRIRSEGFEDYVISPSGEREVYSSIVYLEPFSGRNLRAFGYDMYSDPIRRVAMQRAADTQDPAWSDKVTLVQEDGNGKNQPGFIAYVPIYAKNKPLNTVDERRAALIGFVYSPFRAWDMLGQLYQNNKRLFELQLFSGAPEQENLLYETTQSPVDAFTRIDLPLVIGGTHWTARFTSNENFNRDGPGNQPLILFLAALAMECLLFMTYVVDARHRKQIEMTSRELEKTNREISIMSALMQSLQNCTREEEAFPILDRIMADLFAGNTGGCFLLNHSETQMDRVSAWGRSGDSLPQQFDPEACWALRRGQKHHYGQPDTPDVRCEHVSPGVSSYLCMPLQAQGKLIGSLYLESSALEGMHDDELLSSVADTLSLSLSNLRLRVSLRDLSIRDSLTGLYNRRYMEESLDRELERARRQNLQVAVVMLDVDHFKQLNDVYGHEAGDITLKRIADQMKLFRRGSDVVCRFGGEEFVLILPDMADDMLAERLESLRWGVENMQVNVEGRTMPVTTVSIGVARFPVDSPDPVELVRMADVAMYKAKQAGRNRIEWAAT